jgi:fructose-bisphosphate aldolase/6-deoxy-5-ketofructose 1-phosphate synthase
MQSHIQVDVPADVPALMKERYIRNYMEATKGSGNLFLFAGDQKVEHMNDDYFGQGISPENAHPEHMFRIAAAARIGAFASQLGLIARYAPFYPNIPYIVKLNSKSHAVPVEQAEAISRQWIDMEQVEQFRISSGLNIVGVGYTVYVGSEHESIMYREAAQVAYQAHRHGMISVFWMYPRGKAIPNEKDPHIVAGAAGIGATLGADFVKVNYPKADNPAEALKEAVMAAGRTKLICAGGASMSAQEYFQHLHDQMYISGAHGTAAGRNIHQRSFEEAVRFCNACYGLIVEKRTVEQAMHIYNTPVQNSTTVTNADGSSEQYAAGQPLDYPQEVEQSFRALDEQPDASGQPASDVSPSEGQGTDGSRGGGQRGQQW